MGGPTPHSMSPLPTEMREESNPLILQQPGRKFSSSFAMQVQSEQVHNPDPVINLAENLVKIITDLKAFKESGLSPFGQAPILEVDGKVISQTGGIARYCGKLGGFYPKDNDFEAAKIDEIIDTATDITGMIASTLQATMGEKEKLDARAKMATEKLPMYFSALEGIMRANGSTGRVQFL